MNCKGVNQDTVEIQSLVTNFGPRPFDDTLTNLEESFQ